MHNDHGATVVRHRKPTLLDAMILIIAVAVGLALARYPLGYNLPRLPVATATIAPFAPAGAAGTAPIHQAISPVVRVSAYVYPSVLTLTIATLVLRFIPPRPSVRRILRQPGAVGCAVAVFCCLLILPDRIPQILSWRGKGNLDSRDFFNLSLSTSRMTGLAVASAWLALALGGRWRAERTWVDWLGQVMAGAWIAAKVLEIAAVWTARLGL
jgi:hypothetical protein